MRRLLAVLSLLIASPVLAQESGWHYSPLPGEGDRAALGCTDDALAGQYLCLAVRCDDDLGIGLYLHSDLDVLAGTATLDIDKESFALQLAASDAPYRAEIVSDPAALIERLQQGQRAYLDVITGPDERHASMTLAGSLAAIHQALYFCAPMTPVLPQ